MQVIRIPIGRRAMLKEYCLWEGNKLPKDAIRFKVARPSVLGVPKPIWEKFQKREIDFKEYSEAYINWAWRSPKARERIKLIARRVKRNKVKDVYLGCYCRDYPCHRFILLSFLADRFGCEVDPVALKKMGEQPIRSLSAMFKELDEGGLNG